MAKKYSSLKSLSSSSTTPYGKSNTSTPSTFKLPNLIETIPVSTSKEGKSIYDYASLASIAESSCPPAKHIIISGGEYRRGSFAIGSNSQDSFRSFDKYPSAIYVNKYVLDSSSVAIDSNYSSVDSIEDLGGTYVDASGTTVNYPLTQGATLLTGNDVDLPNTAWETLVLVYDGRDLAPYAGKRTIKVNFSDNTSVTFPDVMIPGWKNNTGIGESLAVGWLNASTVQLSAWNCDNTNASLNHAHSHEAGYINNFSTPLFAPPSNQMYNLTVTSLGTLHDNLGLWNEGFQPDDNLTMGSSLYTKAHQETWPLGLFYYYPLSEEEWGIVATRNYGVSNDGISVSEMWDAQYNGSQLTNISTPASRRGNPMDADSVQHYKLIQGQLLFQAVQEPGRMWADQYQSTQNEYLIGNLSGLTNTNTADDGGAWYAQIETEMMSASGDVWNNSNLTYNTHEGGSDDGFLGSPANVNSTATFQSVQIYTENIQCASCSAPPGGATSIDVCNDPNSTSYYLYTGVDCLGASVPTDLMNGTASLGANGCTNCGYELVATSVCGGCDCTDSNGLHPQISLTNINAPTTQGGNDASADIEISPVNSGTEPWIYLIEPTGNTSAGLGTGAIDTYTILNGGTGAGNSSGTNYTYTSGSVAGSGAEVVAEVSGGIVTTIDKIVTRGKNYITGDVLTFTSNIGDTFTLTVNSVKGVVVSIHGIGTSLGNDNWFENPHEGTGADATFSNGLKATIGTGIYLQHTGTTATNNYGRNPHYSYPSVLQNIPGVPFKRCDFFDSMSSDTSTATGTTITGLETGSYTVTVVNGVNVQGDSWGCFTQQTLVILPGVTSTNGCTDNDAGTNDGVALNYDPSATVDNGLCIYCRAADGKLVDATSTALNISGAANDGDIFTSTNNSTTVASTTSVATDGSIAYTRTLNSIMNHYAGQIVDANATANAQFKMELYKRTSSTQTLTGASQVGATATTPTNIGFNFDFDSTNWSQGLTYGYYAIKSYVDDPDSASEQEQCFQVDYFIVPVLACITGQPGMQVGITTDNVTITDLDLVVASIPGNSLNPCTTQCCDDPTAFVHYIQNSSIPGCADPTFNVEQTCPAGNAQHITTITGEVQMLINNVWTTIMTGVHTNPNHPVLWGNDIAQYPYYITIYWQHGPGDYRVNRILDYTWPNGTTSQCQGYTNVMTLTAPVCGCTDPNSLNFNPLAVIDDGSCLYCVDGCMDPNATNYNSLATCPGPCTFCIYGCTDPAATNYNPMATCDDGSCIYGVGCGCTDILASNYGYNLAGNLVGYPPPCDDGSCIYGGLFCANPPLIDNLTTTEATCNPACDVVQVYGCTDATAFNYYSSATIDDGSCCYVSGCTDPLACNYDSSACYDDGLCDYSFGCTDSTACNYDSLSICDDGSCEWTSCVGPCIGQTYVPDDNFEAYLEANGMGNGIANDDYVLNVNICTETELIMGWPGQSQNISDLTGVEGFVALIKLIVSSTNGPGNFLTSLDVSANTALEHLDFGNMLIPSIDVSNNPSLKIFSAHSNPISSFDFTQNPLLEIVQLTSCQATTMDYSSNPVLKFLYQGDNNLTGTLDLSNNIALQQIDVNSNNLTGIDVSNSTNLRTLTCNYNDITSFDLTNNTKLRSLVLRANEMTSLDLSNCTDLYKVDLKGCWNLTGLLDVSNSFMTNATGTLGGHRTLNIQNTTLTSIDLGDQCDLSGLGTLFGLNILWGGNITLTAIHVGTAARVTQANAQDPSKPWVI